MVPVFRPVVNDALRRAALEALDSKWWGYGPRCAALEQLLSDSWGSGFSLATASCTSALYLAATAVRERGGEVIVPAITFLSTGMAFLHAGLRVRVADVDPDTLMVTRETIEPLLSSSTAAIITVDLYGQRCGVSEIAVLACARGVALIEDRAHRIGLDEVPLGDFVCLSFNAVKEVPVGEGGLLWCRDERDAARARRASNLGMSVDTWERSRTVVHRDYEFTGNTGLKLRLNDLAAALALASIAEVPAQRARRQAIHDAYLDACHETGVAVLVRQTADSQLMQVARMRPDVRDAFQRDLGMYGIASGVHYPSLTDHEQLDGHCPVAEGAAREVVTLPSSADMTDTEIAAVAGALCQAARRLRVR